MFRFLFVFLIFFPAVCYSQVIPPIPVPPVPKPLPRPAPPPAPTPNKSKQTNSPTSNPQSTQEKKEKPKKLPNVREHWVEPPKDFARPTKHILFLIDSSGSMDGDRIGTAIEFVLNKRTGVAAAPFDDFYVALATFGSGVSRWEGTLDINPDDKKPMSPYGWSAMPSADNLATARRWINSNLDGGGTKLILGLQHVFDSSSGIAKKDASLAGLRKSVAIEELTILVITDGEVENEEHVDRALTRLQDERKKSKLPLATIGFVGIDVKLPDKDDPDDETGHTLMKALAKKHGRLGYMRIEFLPEPDEEEEED